VPHVETSAAIASSLSAADALAHRLLTRWGCEPDHTGSPRRQPAVEGRLHMLETIAVILLVLWLLGLVSGYTMGNFIYILLVIAIVLILVRLISGRRVV